MKKKHEKLTVYNAWYAPNTAFSNKQLRSDHWESFGADMNDPQHNSGDLQPMFNNLLNIRAKNIE